MHLDLVIATLNRCSGLATTLDSVLAATVPPEMAVSVIVVDNGSTDKTREVVQSYLARFDGRLTYLFEGHRGKANALNTGIQAGCGDLVGMIDDDERIDPRWFMVAAEWFQHQDIGFIGGPYVPDWEVPRPAWLPDAYCGAIGALGIVPGEVQAFGSSDSLFLPGGNAIIRRSVFERVGLYETTLARFCREDEDMYRRLMAAGVKGNYVPDLVIQHHIPAARLRKSYFRKWVFNLGTYLSLQEQIKPEPVAHLLGIPRYLFGRVVYSYAGLCQRIVKGDLDRSGIFAAELSLRTLAGHLYGRHFHRQRSTKRS